MTRATSRSVALRQADAVLARRADAIRAHEDALRDVLADYFHARVGADGVRAKAEAAVARVRQSADARIARLLESAEQEAAMFEQRARAAVRRMLELGESRDAVAQATGLELGRIARVRRSASAEGHGASGGADPAV